MENKERMWLISGDSLGLTAKADSELGLMALGCIALYLQEALIDQANIQKNFYTCKFNTFESWSYKSFGEYIDGSRAVIA